MNTCIQMMEQMGYVAMEEYEEIVVLQSCCMMISLVFQNLKKISGSDRAASFELLRDDAFGLKTYMMKSPPQRGFTDEKRVYNYCHCRACRISENLFGIISNRWRVLQATILLPPESVKNVVMAILVLHNHL